MGLQLRERDKGAPANGGRFAGLDRPAGELVLEGGDDRVLAGLPVPEYRPKKLTHIGSLNPAEKGSWSLEGQGLSVSRHPEAWGRIARLGGPVWTVAIRNPRFLDYHQLTAEQKQAITEWGITRGFVEERPAFRHTCWDDEWEQERYTDYLDRDEAEEEAEYSEGEIAEVTALVATAEFPDTTVKPGTDGVEEILATVWVSHTAHEFDGVWWEDDYDPELLSAPRGVIVPRAIPLWVKSAREYDGWAEED